MGGSKGALAAVNPISAAPFFGKELSGAMKPDRIDPQAVDPLRPEFRGLSSDLGAFARTLVGKNATNFSGTGVAPITGGEQDVLGRILGFDTIPGQFAGGYDTLVSDILSGRRLSPDTNPYLSGTLDAIRTQGQETLGGNLNLLDAMFGKAGLPSGSGRSSQAIEATRRVTGDVNNSIAQILSGNYQQGLAEQNAILSLIPQVSSMRLGNLNTQLQALGLPRQIDQQGKDFEYQEFLRRLSEPMQYAELVSRILGSAPGLQYVTPQYAPSKFDQVFGAIGNVGQLLGGIKGGK